MTIWGAFANSTLAMIAQSNSLGTISQNVANVNTNGYKRSESLFKTVLSESHPNLDIFSTRSVNRQLVDYQGPILATGNWSDLAVNGDGLFIVNTQQDGSGETLFTRDGSFQTRAIDSDGDGVEEVFLVDGNGNHVQGWEAAADGTVSSGNNIAGLTSVYFRLGQTIAGRPTTTMELAGNVNASATTNQTMSATVYDGSYNPHTLSLTWSPTAQNAWDLTFATPDGTVTTPATAAQVTFNADGSLATPATPLTVAVTWADGSTSSMTVDLSQVTQFANATHQRPVVQDGVASGRLRSTSFDADGNLVGHFDNGISQTLYRLATATFRAPNQLEARSGNLFARTTLAGDMEIVDATTSRSASFLAGAVERSNVDLADEFTRMIMSQKAYTSAATVFRTADEMVLTARDLK